MSLFFFNNLPLLQTPFPRLILPRELEMSVHLKSEQVLSRVMLNTPSSRTLFLCTVPPNTLFIICRAKGLREKAPHSLHHSTPHSDRQQLTTFLLL